MIVFFLTWFSQQAPPCACERIPPSSSGWSRQQSSPGCRFRPSSARRTRSCLDPLWQAEAQLQELGRIGISNKVRICYSMLNQQFRMSYFRTTTSNSTHPPFWYFYSSCHPVPWLCPHLSPQSSTSQFFGISRTAQRSAWWRGELCCCPPPLLGSTFDICQHGQDKNNFV